MKGLLFGVALVLAGTPALADPDIKINQCVMGYVTAGDDSAIGHGIDFTNNTHHVITAIRFNFVFLTPFNEVLGNTIETDTGAFTPGVEINHTERDTTKETLLGGGTVSNLFGGRHVAKIYRWQVQNPSQESLTKMKVACELDAVSFQDGTIWTAPPKK